MEENASPLPGQEQHQEDGGRSVAQNTSPLAISPPVAGKSCGWGGVVVFRQGVLGALLGFGNAGKRPAVFVLCQIALLAPPLSCLTPSFGAFGGGKGLRCGSCRLLLSHFD